MSALTPRGQATRDRLVAAAREVFDVSGAGDTSLAALVLALAAGAKLADAAHFANAAAGVVALGEIGDKTQLLALLLDSTQLITSFLLAQLMTLVF